MTCQDVLETPDQSCVGARVVLEQSRVNKKIHGDFDWVELVIKMTPDGKRNNKDDQVRYLHTKKTLLLYKTIFLYTSDS